MRLVIIEVPYKENTNGHEVIGITMKTSDFDFKKSKFIDFCDESNYIEKCKLLMPLYSSNEVHSDLNYMMDLETGYRRLCPQNGYYFLDLDWSTHPYFYKYHSDEYNEAYITIQEQLRILKINSVMD